MKSLSKQPAQTSTDTGSKKALQNRFEAVMRDFCHDIQRAVTDYKSNLDSVIDAWKVSIGKLH